MAGNALKAILIPEKVFSEKFAPPFPDYFPQFVKEIYFAILENMYWRLPQQHPGFDFKSLRTEIEYGKKWFRGDLSETENDVSAGDWWEAESNMIYILARCEHAATLDAGSCNKWVSGEIAEKGALVTYANERQARVKDRKEFQRLLPDYIDQIKVVADVRSINAFKRFMIDYKQLRTFEKWITEKYPDHFKKQ